MTDPVYLEEFKEEDIEWAKELYKYYTLHSTAVYYLEPPTYEDVKDMIPIRDSRYRSFTISTAQDKKIGFCYYSRFKEKAAFHISVEITLYLKPCHTGQGVGKSVLKQIEPYIRQNGFSNIMALISADNRPSIRLFEHCGYKRCAHIENVAEKFNRKLTLDMYQKQI